RQPGKTYRAPALSTVVVTGATGFVGRHLCPALAHAGHGVRPADPRVPGSIDAALPGADALVHLAARVHVMRDTAADPLAEFRRVNTEATLELARAALRQGVRRFVFLSTIKVNGERTDGAPFSERDVPRPADPYALSK